MNGRANFGVDFCRLKFCPNSRSKSKSFGSGISLFEEKKVLGWFYIYWCPAVPQRDPSGNRKTVADTA